MDLKKVRIIGHHDKEKNRELVDSFIVEGFRIFFLLDNFFGIDLLGRRVEDSIYATLAALANALQSL
jgi:membrane protein required for beta-lactamase induction